MTIARGSTVAGLLALTAPGLGQTCFVASAPEREMVPRPSGALVGSTGCRFLSFSAGDPGRIQAIRVTFASLPPPWDTWSGRTYYVGAPWIASEKGGDRLTTPPAAGEPGFKTATLQCAPEFRDWSAEGVVHVYHIGINSSRHQPGEPAVPALYEVQVLDSTCAPETPESFSDPLEIIAARWGDIAELANGQFFAQDGEVTIGDVLAVLAKFSSDPNAPTKPRVDMMGDLPGSPAGPVNGRITVSDTIGILNAFVGQPDPVNPVNIATQLEQNFPPCP